MLRRVLVVLMLSVGLIQPLLAAEDRSDDEQRMKEQLIALSRGKGSVADLRIEGFDGAMLSSTHFEIADGRVVRKKWERPGSPAQQDERAVTDEEIRALLRELVAKKYWTFEGTRPIPDAPMFLFRFYYKDLQPVGYSCDAHEYQQSPQRSAIRDALWAFVSGASPTEQPATRGIETIDASELKKAELVFVGTAKSVEPFPYECGVLIGWQHVHYEVHELLKGQLGESEKKQLAVGYLCGVHGRVSVGQERLVLCWKREYDGMPAFWESLKTLEATSSNLQKVQAALSIQVETAPSAQPVTH